MAFNFSCFRNCMKDRMSFWAWVAFGALLIAVFIYAFFSLGLGLLAAAAWAAAVAGFGGGGLLVSCCNKCC